MFNRITQQIQRAPPKGPPDTYALIETVDAMIPVYAWVGARVAAELQRFWTPRWITFRDVAGAQYTVRSKCIRAVVGSSPKVRATVRAFYRDRERERDEDASWE